VENEIFAMARENAEMLQKGKEDYANPEMVDKIQKIED
jgi:hypothetical protein